MCLGPLVSAVFVPPVSGRRLSRVTGSGQSEFHLEIQIAIGEVSTSSENVAVFQTLCWPRDSEILCKAYPRGLPSISC